MDEPTTPTSKFISELFITSNATYFIPKYQRGFVWQNDKIEDLLNDISENRQHFLGTLLFINRRIDDDHPSRFEIVDGQQRLATISLLLCAIYKQFNTLPSQNTFSDEIIEDINDRKKEIKKILVDPHISELRLTLSEQGKNSQDYKSILKMLKILENVSNEPYFKNRRLFKGYSFLLKKIAEKNIDELISLQENLKNAYTVRITVNNSQSAYLIFECLNDRGQSLTAIDLIKNYIFFKIEQKANIENHSLSPSERKRIVERKMEETFKNWNTILSNIDDFAWQDRFLRHYYLSFNHDARIKVENYTYIKESETPKIYEKLADKDVSFIFSELFEKSTIYKKFMDPEILERPKLKKALIHLKFISAKPAYILLLYLFVEYPAEYELHEQIADFLVKYFIRRHLTGKPDTNKLDKSFIRVIGWCESQTDPRQITSANIIQEILINPDARYADLADLKQILEDDIYEISANITRVILEIIEGPHQTRTDRDLWDKYFEIEHILPKGDNLPQPWIQMLSNGDENEAKKIKKDFQHKFGNLTLTAYNKELSNKDFEYKRDRLDENGNPVGYKNNFYLNNDLRNKRKWGKDEIKARTKRLVREAINELKFSNE
jgi:uncharacterized protein with ParB-like and HNH nuclease domain